MLFLPKDYFMLRYPHLWDTGEYAGADFIGATMFTKQQVRSKEVEVLDLGESLVMLGNPWWLDLNDSVLGGILTKTRVSNWPSLYVVSKTTKKGISMLDSSASAALTIHTMAEIRQRPEEFIKAAAMKQPGERTFTFRFGQGIQISDHTAHRNYAIFVRVESMQFLLDLEGVEV